jgi:RNA polymerase sigma factor (sigma-70 family)
LAETLTASPPTDGELIERVLAGDDGAFEALVARHRRRVFAIARHFFRQAETVEDVAQETFTKAFFALASYQRGASFEHWLARIAVNNCYDELRRRKARGEFTAADLSEEEADWLEGKLARFSVAAHVSAAERATAGEIAGKILAALPPEDRLILTLLHAEEYAVAEIAELLNWSEARVKIRAFRARHAARKVMQRLLLAEQRKQRRPVAAPALL